MSNTTERKTVGELSRDMGLRVRVPNDMEWDWAQGLEAHRMNETEWSLDDLTGAWRMRRMEDELVIMPTEPAAHQSASDWVLATVTGILVMVLLVALAVQLFRVGAWLVGV